MEKKEMVLSNEFISYLISLIQLAILTGTDLSDMMERLTLYEKDGELYLTDETKLEIKAFIESLNNSVEKAMKELGISDEGQKVEKEILEEGNNKKKLLN